MSTAELKQMIDQRTLDERKWMASYLLDEMFSVPELRQTAEELAELTHAAERPWRGVDRGWREIERPLRDPKRRARGVAFAFLIDQRPAGTAARARRSRGLR